MYIVDILLTGWVFSYIYSKQPGIYLFRVENKNNKKVMVFVQN